MHVNSTRSLNVNGEALYIETLIQMGTDRLEHSLMRILRLF